MKKLKKSPISIVCYVLAALALVYCVYAIGAAIVYLNSYFTAYGTSIGANLKDAFTYIVGQSFTPLTSGVLLFMTGHINDSIRSMNPDNYVEVASKTEAKVASKAETAEEDTDVDAELEAAIDVEATVDTDAATENVVVANDATVEAVEVEAELVDSSEN